MQKIVAMVIVLLVARWGLAEDSSLYTQEGLERWLYSERGGTDDYFNNPMTEYVPLWRRDAIERYQSFISEGHWTTNQLIDALILAVTNHLHAATWPSERDETIAGIALGAISEINLPRAKSFILNICTNDIKTILVDGVDGIYAYSHLEPEVFDYLYRLCVMTNRYEKVVGDVAIRLEGCLANVPDAQKPAATNRVAKYHYFVINHTTASNGSVDYGLALLVPSYANSIQRLRAMRHVANTTTHAGVLRYATNQVHRLESLPTNALNNVQWLEE